MASSEHLVGRDHVRATLLAALDDVRAGVGRTVLLSGEPGIGKSAMLSWLAVQATGAQVLRGFCWEGDGAPPYWPWTLVLRAAGVCAEDLDEVAWLLGGSATPEPDTAAAAADAQFRLCDTVTEVLLRQASPPRPIVIVLDDLQWADEPSLSLLSFLNQAATARPVLVTGAFRDGEVSPRLAKIAAQARHHVPLAGLTLPEVEALVDAMPGHTLDPHVTKQIWERAGGNPFFIRELTQLVQAYGAHDAPSRLPASVVETVRQRLARLSTDCTRLLDWAAVAGRDIDVNLLVAAGAADDHGSAFELLGDARQAGMITGADDLRFTHDIYREAIAAGQPATLSSAIHLALGRALGARSGSAAQVAAHLLQAGPAAQDEALDYSLQAAREATARLGHDDACRHYQRALALLDDTDERRLGVIVELAAVLGRAGYSDDAMQRYRQAAQLSGERADGVGIARAALGMQSLGHRSGGQNTDALELLREADHALTRMPEEAALHSRVLAALTRALRHGSYDPPDQQDLLAIAERAVRLSEQAGDPDATAAALLAVHDAMWAPGTAEQRLPVVERMLGAAEAAGNPDLVAEAHLLRATALVELGDRAGSEALLGYITLAAGLGHARGRWGALTRQATYLAITGRAEDAARVGEQARQLGQAIGEPDALGVFYTHRAALAPLGIPFELHALTDVPGDPLWPLFPLIDAWPLAVRGDAAAARAALGDFSVQAVPSKHDLEILAIAGMVFAVAGTGEQRGWAYDSLQPHAGRQVVVGGCAAYHGAVDHILGKLAAALSTTDLAQGHLRAAVEQYEHLGAAGFARLARQDLLELAHAGPAVNEFRVTNGLWRIDFAGRQAQLADAKGLQDIAMLLAVPGTDIHVLDLLGVDEPKLGADPVLDDTAKAQYKARLKVLEEGLDAADARGDDATAKRLVTEQEALLAELSRASGLSGRPRRLGDTAERARKTVGARVRDALGKLDHAHPELAAHLRDSLRLGATCSYTPAQPVQWQIGRDAPTTG